MFRKRKRKKKRLLVLERMIMITQLFEDLQDEYHENNSPTDLYEMFWEVLTSMPYEHLKVNNTLGLFNSALKDVLGTDYKEEKPKPKFDEIVL